MTRKSGWTSIGVLAVCLFASAAANAQVSFEPRKLRAAPLKVPFDTTCDTDLKLAPDAAVREDALGELNRRYHSGAWGEAQKAAKYMLDHARCASGTDPSAAAFDYRGSYVWLTWIGQDSFESYGLRRLLVHEPAPVPYKLDLPGVSKFYEVFASESDAATVTTVLTSTEKADETLAQIPAVAARALPALFGLVAATRGPVPPLAAAPVAPGPFWVLPFQVDLPARRAAVTVKTVAGEPVPPDEFAKDAQKLALKTGFQLSQCAHDLAAAAATTVTTARNSAACGPGQTPKTCLGEFDKHLREAFDAQQKKPSCAGDADKKAMAAVDTEFRSFVTTGMAREVKSDMTFANTPRQHVSFGLVEAVAFKARVRDPRVKVNDDGNLQADPMPRLLTIVTVNSSFTGYDASAIAPTAAERWRWFGGAVITPDFGVAAGLSYLPIRGLSINLGGAWMFTKTASAEAIGKPPADATDPFGLGTAWAVFIGAGYNFK